MATYLELQTLRTGSNVAELGQRIVVALCIKANAIAKLPTPTDAQRAWAKSALATPDQYIGMALSYILAEYNTTDATVITSATDAQVQVAVDAAVDTLLAL